MAATVKTNPSAASNGGGDVVLHGYLKKLKTMKKKYFVLRSDSAEASARLEYYDSEKKYKARSPPKRAILLRSCFNINRRSDTKHKCVIALHMKDNCFCIVCDNEDELHRWLQALQAQVRTKDEDNKDNLPETTKGDTECSTEESKSPLGVDEVDNFKFSDSISLGSTITIQSESKMIQGSYGNRRESSSSDADDVSGRIAGVSSSFSDSSCADMSCTASTSSADRLVESEPYVPMSPQIVASCLPHCRHSRASSTSEDGPMDFRYGGFGSVSFVNMTNDSGYVPMSGNGSVPRDYADMEPARSMSRTSVTSGTPSTDLRFSEYHLEKVTSYFAPSSDDEDSRPVRAYSVGSRPEHIIRKNHLNAERIANSQSNASRIRAFSVGSRSKLQQQQAARQSHHHVQGHQTHAPITHHGAVHNQHSRKASSAPLLSTSWGERTGRTLHGSVEPMDDLMEMDFTRNKSPVTVNTCSGDINIKRRHLKNEGYVDMTSKNSNSNGYVEMRPLTSNSLSDVMSSSDTVDGYMDMTPSNTSFRQRNISAPSTSPLQPNCISSPRGLSLMQMMRQITMRQNNQQQEYVDMSPSSPRQENRNQHVDNLQKRTQVTPDGYVEMSWNGGRRNNNHLASSADDYINMSFDKEYRKNQKNMRNYDATTASSLQFRHRRNSTNNENIAPFISPIKPCFTNKMYHQRKCLSHASNCTECLDSFEDGAESQITACQEGFQQNCCNGNNSSKDHDYVNCKPTRRLSPPPGDYVLLLTSA